MKKLIYSLGLLITMLFQFLSSEAQVFPGSTIVDPSDNAVMTNWIGNNPGGTLLYRRSRDGANSSTFHNLCDNQGPTVVVFKTAYGTVFGGYASDSWLTNYGYIQANNSFLFNLTTDQRVTKGGYYGANNPYGLYSNYSYGPTFGAGHDFYMSSDMNSGSTYLGNSYNNFTSFGTYSTQEIEAFMGPGTNGNSFSYGFIVEIEVYKITLNYSTPVVIGRNIKRYLNNSGVVSITAAMIDSASTDPDGIASITIDKTSFDCSNIGGGTAIPITNIGSKNQITHSYGGGYNPNTNQFYYPEWANPTIYVYNNDGSYVNSINTGQPQMMQVWMNSGSSDLFTANWGYNTYTRRSGSNVVWTYTPSNNYYYYYNYAAAITSDGAYVYTKEYGTNFINVLDINTGSLLRTITLPGIMYNYGGMVVANGFIYITGYAENFSTYQYNWNAIHVFNMNGVYQSSTQTNIFPASMAYDGETMWISDQSNTITGFKISNGNSYTGNGNGSTVRLTVTDNLGNVGFKDYAVQVLDTITPSITLNGNTIEVAPFGGPWNDPNVTGIDNCPKPAKITGTVDVNNKGIYQLSYQMTDAGGNLSNTLNRTVYVGAYDTTAPTAIAKNITVNLALNSTGNITLSDIDNGSFDLNGLKSKTISKDKFTCTELGVQTVTLIVEDFYGQKDTATAQVTVIYDPQYTISQNYACVYGSEGTAEVVSSSSNVGANLYYGTTGNSSGGTRLVSFNPVTGASTTIGYTGTGGMPAVAVNSLGDIYATTSYDLYSLNKTTGYATYIRSISYCSNIAAMAFKNDVLHIIDRCGYLYTVDINTGAINQLTYTGVAASGIQFDPTDGSLWFTDRSTIFKLDMTNYSVTNVGYTGTGAISDLVFNSQGTLYAIQGGGGNSQIYTVNKTNGSITFQANTISNIAGAASGSSGLSFTWSNGQTGPKATNLSAGTYTVTISGAQGCSVVDTVVVGACAPVLPVVTINATDSVICNSNAVVLTASATTTLPSQLTAPSSNFANSLIAYYKFDETSGTSVSDQTNNNLDGSFAGYGSSYWASSGAFTGSNNGVNIGGYGSYVNVPDNSLFNTMQNSFTIESWIYQTDNYNNTIVDRANYNFLFQANANGSQGLGFYNPNIGWIYDYTYLPTYQWTHVAVTWEASTSQLKFYVNGNLSSTNYVGNMYFNNGPLNIGRQEPNGCQCNFMDGTIDELRIWNVTRTQSEIQSNYNKTLNSTPAAPTHTYVWTPSTGLNTNTGEQVTANPSVTTTYTVTATNNLGSSASTSKTIVVSPLASNVVTVNGPISVCPGSIVALQADQNPEFTYQWYNNGNVIANATASLYNATVTGTYTVQITNAANCVVNTLPVQVTVQDITLPVALTQNISRTITSSTGAITITAADIDNGSFDNCSIANMSIVGNNTFDCNTVSGVYSVVLSVTDGSGNTSSQTANITITNACNTAPVAICQSITVPTGSTTNTGNASAIDFNNGSTDAENDVLSFSVSPAGPYALGTTNVVLTVSDPAGLSSTCNASITVVDQTNPVVVAQNTTVSVDANGNASISVSDVNNGSSDNVGITSLTVSQTNFNCSNLGANTVVLTATDAAGNSSSASATVTVVDNTAPNAIAQNLSINLDAAGNASITVADVNNGSNDNCSVANISIDKTTFNCSNLGANTVVLTVTDGSGNTSTASATVTVIDNTAPNAIAQNLSINLDATGNASITATDVNNGSNDNCSVANISIDKTNFNCSNLGANTVVLTATDAAGNSSSASATVTVIDNIAPVAITKNITLNLSNTTATLTAADVNDGSYDNCGITVMNVYPNTFTCADEGNHVVTFIIEDASGNYATATANVFVTGGTPSLTVTGGTAVAGQAANTIYKGYGAQSITLNAQASGASTYTYSWSPAAGLSNANIANPVASPSSTTTYTVTATSTGGCTTTSTITICVLDVRSKNTKGAYDGKVLICHVTGSTVTNTLSIASSAVASHLAHGDKLGTCGLSCNTSGKEIDLTENSNHDLLNLVLYPNPTTSSFNFLLESSLSESVTFRLFDVTGRLVYELQNVSSNESYQTGELLPAGVYVMEAIQGTERKVLRVVKTQ